MNSRTLLSLTFIINIKLFCIFDQKFYILYHNLLENTELKIVLLLFLSQYQEYNDISINNNVCSVNVVEDNRGALSNRLGIVCVCKFNLIITLVYRDGTDCMTVRVGKIYSDPAESVSKCWSTFCFIPSTLNH